MDPSFPSFALIWLAVPLVVFVLLVLVRGRKKKSVSYPYVAAEGLFTPNERHFLAVLEEAAGECRVFGKVRVADVIEVRQGLPKGEQRGAFNRIGQKHLDFVLCDPHDLSIFCAVELDDRTHGRADRRARDAFLEGALAAAQVPLVRVPSKQRYDVAEVRALLDARTLQKAAQGR